MRGYLSRTGLGLVTGLAILGVVAPALLHVGSGSPCAATVGPFRIAVERAVVSTNGHSRAVVAVQLHLWRPDGPVPLAERANVNGDAWLGGAWRLTDKQWLIRNETQWEPRGDYLVHPLLGHVPATRHAGEARGLLEFTCAEPSVICPSPVDLTFELPDGRSVTLANLPVEPPLR